MRVAIFDGSRDSPGADFVIRGIGKLFVKVQEVLTLMAGSV
jgi:hypothetical protein